MSNLGRGNSEGGANMIVLPKSWWNGQGYGNAHSGATHSRSTHVQYHGLVPIIHITIVLIDENVIE